MSAWIECLVSIRFDLDIGPDVEHECPKGTLSTEGLKDIVHAAFPDCNPACGHDFVFFFTVPASCLAGASSSSSSSTPPNSTSSPSNSSSNSNEQETPSRAGETHPTGLRRDGGRFPPLFGAAYYRQKRDPAVPRGYVQQVVVLLSRLPYRVMHELVIRLIAQRFGQCCHLSPDDSKRLVSSVLSPQPIAPFEPDGSFHAAHHSQWSVLQQALQETQYWPSPHPHVEYHVTLLNQALTFITPPRTTEARWRKRQMAAHANDNRIRATSTETSHPDDGGDKNRNRGDDDDAPSSNAANGSSSSSSSTIAPTVCLDDRVRILDERTAPCPNTALVSISTILGSAHLSHLTKLWELLIAHQPLLVLSATPSTASAASSALAALLAPLRLDGHIVPYLTIQQRRFSEYAALGKPATPFPAGESVVLCGTNPCFPRVCSKWPNLLSVCDPTFSAVPASSSSSSAFGRTTASDQDFTRGGSIQTIPVRGGGVDVLEHSSSSLHQGGDVLIDEEEDLYDYGDGSSSCGGGGTAHSRQVSDVADMMTMAQSPRTPLSLAGSIPSTPPPPPPASAMLSPAHHHNPSSSSLHNRRTSNAGAVRSKLSTGAVEALFTASGYPFVLLHRELTKQLQERVRKTLALPPEASEIHCALNPCTRAAPSLNSRALNLGDEAIAGFFSSLTNDFLSPVHHWVHSVLAVTQLEPFQLCRMPPLPLPVSMMPPSAPSSSSSSASSHAPAQSIAASSRGPMGGGVSLFSRDAFLVYLHANRKGTVVSSTFRETLSYAAYRVLYEKFTAGILFNVAVMQVVDRVIRKEIDTFDAEAWERSLGTPPQQQSAARHLSGFLDLFDFLLLERRLADPDLVLLTKGIAILTEMLARLPQNLHHSLQVKIDLLQF